MAKGGKVRNYMLMGGGRGSERNERYITLTGSGKECTQLRVIYTEWRWKWNQEKVIYPGEQWKRGENIGLNMLKVTIKLYSDRRWKSG